MRKIHKLIMFGYKQIDSAPKQIFAPNLDPLCHNSPARKKRHFGHPQQIRDLTRDPIRTLSLIRRSFLGDNQLSFGDYDHAFVLRRLSKYCYHETVIVDFVSKKGQTETESGTFNQDRFKQENQKCDKLYPVYNRDERYFTPAFVQAKELIEYEITPLYQLQKFRDKIQQTQVRTSEIQSKAKINILVAKPNSIKCQICKCQFDDYREHIEMQKHQKLFHNTAWDYVNQLIEEFQIKNKQEISQCKGGKKKQLTKSNSSKQNSNRNKRKVEQLIEEVNQTRKQKTKQITKQCTGKSKKQIKTITTSSTQHNTAS